jgi:hypothetical protein
MIAAAKGGLVANVEAYDDNVKPGETPLRLAGGIRSRRGLGGGERPEQEREF